jgi:type IV secretory pathway TraG/TraD family ATPase VirD4
LDKNLEDIIIKVILTSITTFFFSTALDIFLEEFNLNNLKKNLFRLIPILFSLVFYYFLNIDNDSESVVYVALTISGFIGFLFISSFLLDLFKNYYKENLYYNYFYKVSLSFLIAFIL